LPLKDETKKKRLYKTRMQQIAPKIRAFLKHFDGNLLFSNVHLFSKAASIGLVALAVLVRA
jgi:hypothetical protein